MFPTVSGLFGSDMTVIRHVEPPGRASTDESIIPPAAPVFRESLIPGHLRLVSYHELRAILICGFGASDRIIRQVNALDHRLDSQFSVIHRQALRLQRLAPFLERGPKIAGMKCELRAK